ncbi:hypothetical protein KAR10_01850 [bacterium]|nr:hypothetical protein [bacterium]
MKKAMKIRILVGLVAGGLLCVPAGNWAKESVEVWNLKRWVEEAVKMRFEGGCINAKITLESVQGARDPIYKLLPVSVPLYNNYCTVKGLQLNLEQLGLSKNEARVVAGKISRMNKKEFIEYFEKTPLKFVDAEERYVFDAWESLTSKEKNELMDDMQIDWEKMLPGP